jgi:uncharacterized membrane protein
MQKAHDASYNHHWEDLPSIESPIIALQLNRIEQNIDTIDDRVVTFDLSKANQTDMLQAVRSIIYTKATGTFRITFFNGTYVDIDTDLEKLAVNFDYDDDPTSPTYQQIIITLEDGTKKYIDISALITQYEFANTSTIHYSIAGDGTISFSVPDGGITAEKLQPNYLADITAQANRAGQYATASSDSATLSQSWAEGDTGARVDEDTRNSKYYALQAEETVAELLAAFGISVIGTRLIFGATFDEQYEMTVSGTLLTITERSNS